MGYFTLTINDHAEVKCQINGCENKATYDFVVVKKWTAKITRLCWKHGQEKYSNDRRTES